MPTETFDANDYAGRKTEAQTVLDMALITTTAGYLKYIWDLHKRGDTPDYFKLDNFLLISSIVMQLFTGLLMIIIRGYYNINTDTGRQLKRAKLLNNVIAAFTMVILVLNALAVIFVASTDTSNNTESATPGN